MKTLKASLRKKPWVPFFSVCAVITACVLWIDTAKSDDLPGLKIETSLTDSSLLLLTVTNGVSTNNYEIYRRLTLDALHSWNLHLLGTNGQTNFTASMGIDLMGFFEARSGNDADADGVANSRDGDPYNSAVGALTITIDSPTNGANLQ